MMVEEAMKISVIKNYLNKVLQNFVIVYHAKQLFQTNASGNSLLQTLPFYHLSDGTSSITNIYHINSKVLQSCLISCKHVFSSHQDTTTETVMDNYNNQTMVRCDVHGN